MKKTFRKNLLFILVFFFAYSAYSWATTYSRAGGTSQYVGGTKAVGPTVDADFNGLVSWLNTGNIDDTNLIVQGISANKIKNFALTFTQMSTGNLLATSSSSSFTMTGVVPVQVTNLSTTITTTGHNIRIWMEPYPGTFLSGGLQTYGSRILLNGGTDGDFDALWFVRNSATTAYFTIAQDTKVTYPCSGFGYTENNLAAGTYTFSVMVSGNFNGDNVSVVNCRLVVQEEF